MNNFDRAMNVLDEEFNFVSSSKQYISMTSEHDKVSASSHLPDGLCYDYVHFLSYFLSSAYNTQLNGVLSVLYFRAAGTQVVLKTSTICRLSFPVAILGVW